MQRRRPRILPPIVQKRQQRLTVVLILLALPMMGVMPWELITTDNISMTSINLTIRVGLVTVAVMFLLVVLDVLWFLKFLARVEREDRAVCVHCGYSLVGLGEAGNCPECSERFTLAEAEALWKNARLRPRERQRWNPTGEKQ